MPRVYVWHIPEQQLDLPRRGYADIPLLQPRSGCTPAAKLANSSEIAEAGRQAKTRPIVFRALITSLATAWEFCCFWASALISHLVFIVDKEEK